MGSKRITLSEFAVHQKGFAFKSNDYKDSGIAVVRVSNFTNDSIDISDLKFVNADVAKDKAAFELLEDDVVIATVGSWPNNPASVVGKVIRVPANASKSLLNQNAVRLRPLSNDANDLQFLFYLLKDKTFSDYIVSTAQGSANQASITLKDIYAYEFDCPDYQSRKLIAKNLYALDKKITLNRQINQTLEQMAQTLFKSWFVDFDPVIDNALDAGNDIPDTLQERAEQRRLLRAKADFKSLPAATRALFPSEFEETELGWVPKGWEVRFLNEVTNIVYGKNLPTSKIGDTGYPVYGGNGIIGFYDKYLYENQQVLVSCRGAASGKVHLSKQFSFVTNNSLVIENKDIPTDYLYQALLNQDLTTLTSGSAQPQMTIANMNPVQILVPDVDVLNAYSSFSASIYKSVFESEKTTETLTNIRDSLLPKLISGELALDDLPAEIAEAAEAL